MAEGKIKKLLPEKKIGFIQPDKGGKDVFFHFSLLKGIVPHEGQRVAFDIEQVEKGLRARELRIMNADYPALSAAIAEESDKYRYFNPYNFLRNLTEKRPNHHVLGNCQPPPHDRYVGLSGRITCKVDAITSLFVSDSHAVKEKSSHRTYRFFQYCGQPVLPASSLRGMIRSVFEAVTNSCYVAFQKDEPYSLEYRGSRAPKMIPARVVDLDGRGAHLELLDCTVNSPVNISVGSTVVTAGAVLRAYPPCVFNQGTKQPFNQAQSQLPPGAYDGMRVAALVTRQPEKHRSDRFRAFYVTKVVPKAQHQSLTEDEQHVKVFGWLHLTGPNIENKHDERLFFRWDDKQPEPPRLDEITLACLCECSSEVIKEYNHHLKEYWERQQKKVVELGNQRWPNSTNGVPHPSTFVEKDRVMKIGDLVYVRHDKQGVVTLLRSVSIPRIRYKYLRQDFLQEHLKHCQNYNELCPACRVFGWVREGAKGISTDDQTAYAGRVRFSHGKIKEEWQAEEEITLAILSTPKPTTTSFYLVNPKGHPDPAVTYDTDGARLRGRKVYRHHGQISFAECKSNNKSDQNRTIKGVLNPRTTFTFAVDFENLAQLELGALLYALEMEEGMVHRLGFAKPLGFGSVKVTAEKVEIIDWEKRLQSITPNAGWQCKDRKKISELKHNFINEMVMFYSDEFNKVLADLRALLGAPSGLPIHYPRPKMSLDPENHPQYEWFVGNKKRNEKRGKGKIPDPVALSLAKDDAGLPLIEKNGREGR